MHKLLINKKIPKHVTKSFQSEPVTKIPPPVNNQLKEQSNFYIKVITYETDPESTELKKYTGYSQDSDIIPKTCEYCESRTYGNHTCSPPIVSTVSNIEFQDCIIVENLLTDSSYIHWIQR